MAERWDLVIELERVKDSKPAVRDFEGLEDAGFIVDIVKHAKKLFELDNMQCDLLANLVYEMLDEGGWVDDDWINGFAYAIHELTTVTYWVKAGVDWDA